MNKYYENTDGQLFVDPIVANHAGLTELTQKQFNKIVAERNKSTTDQLLQQLTQARKEQEHQGVTINGIRYAGDPSNRQAISEAMQFMADAGATEFPAWKDSDDVFHANHPLTDVVDAYRAIGVRRVQIIAAEGQYAVQVQDGTMTDLSEVVWP
jgi:NAD-dependent DNA ligase